jgi:phosphate:Na+ symporter
MVQSSSATTVMLIGFVSAGLMTLQQAIGVILGANVGTTMTAQLIAFKLTDAALPAIAIGVYLKFFTRAKKYRYIGEVILGFGLLFFGMTVMKYGFAPIKKDPTFIQFFTRFDPGSVGGLLLCVFIGAVLTILVQSSSATIGLTMTLATQGLLTFPGAMALVLGENIGTTITAELATIGSSNINAHRAARAHTMFNVIGVTFMLIAFPYFIDLIKFVTMFLGSGPVSQVVEGDVVNISRYIANGHTLFNVINATFFLIFLPLLKGWRFCCLPKKKRRKIFSGCRISVPNSMTLRSPL